MEKILIIDDEQDILKLLSMSLRADGYQTLTASSGKEGIEVFKNKNPDIVLTDIKMPEMTGLEVLKNIKAINPHSEVIIITGHGDIDSAIEALQYGASDFINKPVKSEALAVAIKRAKKKIAIKKQLKLYTEDLELMCGIATKEFERKSKFQEKLIKSSTDGIIATDNEWKIVIFNPEAENIFGYKKQEVIRKLDARQLFPFDLTKILDNKVFSYRETMVKSKTGEEIPVKFSGRILYEQDKLMGSVGFFQDLREIKRLEKELLKSERLAAVGQTVAGMAHCIKNILHGLKGGGYILDLGFKKGETKKFEEGWRMVKSNIARTADLVFDLLSYSKEREPEYEPYSPKKLIKEICDLLQAMAKEHKVQLLCEADPLLPEILIDSKSIYRALLNLASNAIDACIYDHDLTKKHKVSVTVKKEDDNTVVFEIKDNGAGMTEEVKKKLFGSFFSTKGSKGTGLGLLVTQKLIHEHEGTIEVISEEGKGSSFIIRLPLKTG
ncbi:MAG: response regulator [Deltaproteobacteria bacterium]|nr:response regulator [Deltaproteobacteria bacterium]